MRDYTYRYSVKLTTVTGYNTPAGWATRTSRAHPVPAFLTGKPTDGKLARYVADYNASIVPGGVNAHIGPGGRAVAATIFDHNTDTVVATWREAWVDLLMRSGFPA